jgi:hypothetical protein
MEALKKNKSTSEIHETYFRELTDNQVAGRVRKLKEAAKAEKELPVDSQSKKQGKTPNYVKDILDERGIKVPNSLKKQMQSSESSDSQSESEEEAELSEEEGIDFPPPRPVLEQISISPETPRERSSATLPTTSATVNDIAWTVPGVHRYLLIVPMLPPIFFPTVSVSSDGSKLVLNFTMNRPGQEMLLSLANSHGFRYEELCSHVVARQVPMVFNPPRRVMPEVSRPEHVNCAVTGCALKVYTFRYAEHVQATVQGWDYVPPTIQSTHSTKAEGRNKRRKTTSNK